MGFTVGTNMFFFLSCYFNAGFSLINIQFIKVTKLKYSFLMLFISIYKFYSSYKCLFMDLKSIMLTEKKVRGEKKQLMEQRSDWWWLETEVGGGRNR